MRAPTLLILAVLLAAAAPAALGKPGKGKGRGGGSADLPITELDSGERSGVAEAATLVIRDQEAWDAVWDAHRPGTTPPAVDFDRDMVLAVFLGLRPTPNHSVSVERVRESDTVITAEVVERRPKPNCVLPTQVTTPFVIVTVPARDPTVEFDVSVKPARRCGH